MEEKGMFVFWAQNAQRYDLIKSNKNAKTQDSLH